MVKLSILFMQPDDPQTFEERYNFNLSLLEGMPGLKRRQACIVLGGPGGKSPYYRILEFYFDDFAALDAALLSESGRKAGQDLMSFAANKVDLVFSEVFEE
jgi:uncharacterized protein (TIGR02118 family)